MKSMTNGFTYYIKMVNKCVVINWTSGHATGDKKPAFLLPEEEELHKKLIYFVNRKNWAPTKCSCMYRPLP